MRLRLIIVSMGIVIAACGGSGGSTTSLAPSTTTVPTATTPVTTVTTAAPGTTTTTLVDGPVDLAALTPLPLELWFFGATGVGPLTQTGITMALATLVAPPGAPTRSVGAAGPQRLIGVFGAASGFGTDCLTYTLWAEDFSVRLADGSISLTGSGCGEFGGALVPDDQILLRTDRTVVVDLGTTPPVPFHPDLQLSNNAGDAGIYTVGQEQPIDPQSLAAIPPGFVLPFGGELFSLLGAGVEPVALPVPAPGTCEPDTEILCLGGSRFRIVATITRTTEGPGGNATVSAGASVPLGTVDVAQAEGGFWFFDETQLDVMVKVVNGCDINGAFWVVIRSIGEGLDIDVTVTDTRSAEATTYEPSGGPSPAITDTQAFATCP